ncbi:MAG TPA: cytochrome c oxidase subunit 3 [Flavipsychrobacter sp.]|jgi:cytochrome c oxidase subunit III|nr:cytochrome c oxidase subunit 3 [Chitinophagales bacterium]HLO69613.1 cytochrome c oxidase subunit 3 [Flavipsychrobacter sp.]
MSQATTAETKVWGGGRSPFNVSYGKMMMWFFLLSDAFTFSAFLISYGTKRFFSEVWPDANSVFHAFPFMGHANLPLLFVSLMTFILIMSSVTMVLAVHCGHYGDRQGVIKWLLWTIVGGIAFLSCQAWEWTHLAHNTGGLWGTFTDPNTPLDKFEHFFKHGTITAANAGAALEASHSFYNFFFTITGFHGGHVASGVVLLIMALINTVNGTYDKRGHYEMIEKVGLYWHFVDLVWVFVFTCFYLL